MATSAQKQVTQSARQAAEAVDAKKAAMLELPKMISTGKNVSGSVMFDTMPKEINLPRQLVIVITAYYGLVNERGGTHQFITIEELNQVCEEQFKSYSQDAATIIAHYKQQIEGTKAWKRKQGLIKIGQFK